MVGTLGMGSRLYGDGRVFVEQEQGTFMMQRPRQQNTILGFFWHDEYEIETMDTPAEVRAKLAQIVGEVPVFDPIGSLKKTLTPAPSPPAKPFTGIITDETFQLRLYPSRRRTERITVQGQVYASGTGSTVKIKIRLNPITTMLMSGVSLIFLAVLGVVLFTTLWAGTELHPSFYLFPTVLAFMIYLITTMGFWEAATIAKNAIFKALR